jgi:hypothetical protein
MLIRLLVVLAVLLVAVACRSIPRETPSKIVAYAESQGSGDLHLATEQSIRIWLVSHKPVARQIYAMCRAEAPGDATWGETTEGKLCIAVRKQAFYGLGDKK